MPPARLLTKFGVLVGNGRRREVSAPEYGSGGGGETNDSDDDRGRDGDIPGVAATIAVLLCKTVLRGDDG